VIDCLIVSPGETVELPDAYDGKKIYWQEWVDGYQDEEGNDVEGYYKEYKDCLYTVPENTPLVTLETVDTGEAAPEHVHKLTYVSPVEPTCTKAGSIGYYRCNGCSKKFSDEAGIQEITDGITVAAKGHGETYIKGAKEATATQEGYTGDKYCVECDTLIEKGEVIDKLSHNLTHVAAVKATATKDGNIEYYHCEDCGKNFSDAEGTKEITGSVVKKATGSYTIKFDINGGSSGTMKNQTCKFNEAYTLTANSFKAKTGYYFAGWNTKADGSGTAYKNKANITTNLAKKNKATVTLYAQWKKVKYTVAFDANGGTSGSTKSLENCTYGKSYTLTANGFKRKGYTFTGWNTVASPTKDNPGTAYDNKASVKNLSKKNKQTVTLYAQWKKVKYTITYNLNSGKNNSSNPASYYVTTKTINLADPTRTGYTFQGWYSDKDCTKQVTEIKKGSTGNRTLYAKWSQNKYTIKFNGNGNTNDVTMASLKNCKYSTKYTLTKNKFKKSGYTFAGWNTKKNGSGKSYKNQAEVSKLSSKSGGTVTLYAQWKKK
jgi:uncharacterized repeat protein (TIGR02543 family)